MELISAKEKWWRHFSPLIDFAAASLVGTLIFLLIVAPAVSLDLLGSYLVSRNTSPFIVQVFKFLEYLLLYTDAFLFVVYIIVQAVKMAKEFYHDIKS